MSGEPTFTGTLCCAITFTASASNRSAVNMIPGVPGVAESSGRNPARSARSTSPADTASTTTPCVRIRANKARLDDAFCA